MPPWVLPVCIRSYSNSILAFISWSVFFLSNTPVSAQTFPPENQSTPSITDNMALVPGGEYKIGLSPEKGLKECQKYFDRCKLFTFQEEGPERSVSVGGFHIDKYEVTQKHFKSVMGINPSEFLGENLPVERVHWEQASDYCEKVGKRLPTETEWEIAAKGGHNNLYPWGNEMESGKANLCDKNCILEANTGQFNDGAVYTSPVGSYPPNGYGLYDMSGNVWEWVGDWYSENYYQIAPSKDPAGPHFGFSKMIRGGSWINAPDFLRSSFRNWSDPAAQTGYFGFRCALSTPRNK